MPGLRLSTIALAISTCLGGCAATTTTNKVAIDYNRVFAKSRDEVLVTNILRAAAREPMQFSTMGTVTGAVRNNGSITIPFTNLIGGTGGLTISPSTTLNDGINPVVNIVPLGDKDFAEGILKPVPIQMVTYFLGEGWDPQLIMMMAVGAIQCSPDRIVRNSGAPPSDPGSHYDDFAKLFNVRQVSTRKIDGKYFATIRMSGKDSMSYIKDGVGDDYHVDSVTPVSGDPNTVDVKIMEAQRTEIVGLDVDRFCRDIAAEDAATGETVTPAPTVAQADGTPSAPQARGKGPPQGQAAQQQAAVHEVRQEGRISVADSNAKVILRSVESMLYYLGQTHRYRNEADPGWPWYLRQRRYYDRQQQKFVDTTEKITMLNIVRSGSVPIASDVYMRTTFDGVNYYIPRAQEPPSSTPCSGQQCDRTLSTLSFLTALISLQTNPSSVSSATPVVNVGPR